MDYKFRKASTNCWHCDHAFAEGEKFVSALCDVAKIPARAAVESATEGSMAVTTADAIPAPVETDGIEAPFARLDICLACWPDFPRDGLFSWWRSERTPTIKKPPTRDPEFLWMLLSQTGAHAEPEFAGETRDEMAARLAYIAALGLMRLKQLNLKRHFRQGPHTYLVFTQKESRRREITVRDPDLTDAEFEALEAHLTQVAETTAD